MVPLRVCGLTDGTSEGVWPLGMCSAFTLVCGWSWCV